MKKKLHLFLITIFIFTNSYAQQIPNWHTLLKTPERYYQLGKYQKALKSNKNIQKVIDKKYKKNTLYTTWNLINEAKTLEALSNFRLMEDKINQAFALLTTQTDSAVVNFSIIKIAEIYQVYGYPNKADSILKLISPSKDIDQLLEADQKHLQAWIAFERGNFNEVMDITQALLPLRAKQVTHYSQVLDSKTGKAKKISNLEYKDRKRKQADLITLQAKNLTKSGDYNKADSILWHYNKYIRKTTGVKSIWYANHLIALGDNYDQQEQYSKALKYYKMALRASESYDYTFRAPSKTYLQTQIAILKNYSKSESNFITFNQINLTKRKVKKYFSESSTAYLQLNLLQAQHHLNKKAFPKAEALISPILDNGNLPFYSPIKTQAWSIAYQVYAQNDAEIATLENAIQQYVASEKQRLGVNAFYTQLAQLELANYYSQYSDNFKEAKRLFEALPIESIEKNITPQYEKFAAINNAYAAFYTQTDDYKKALNILQKTKQALLLQYDEDHIKVAQQNMQIADLQIKLGNYKALEEEMEKSMKIIRKASGQNSLEYAILLARVARLQAIMSNYDEADKLLRKSSRIFRNASTQNTGLQGEMVEELASLYMRVGEYANTEQLLLENLKNKEAKYSPTSRKLSNVLNQLGNLYLLKGEYATSEKYLTRALQINKASYGVNSLNYVTTLRSLAKLYANLGDFEKAILQIQEVVKTQTSLLGDNHIELAQSYTDLALIQLASNSKRSNDAEKLLLKAKNIIQHNFDNKHPQYAEALKNLAILYLENQKYTEAHQLLDEANLVWIEKLDKQNINSAYIYSLKGDVFTKQKNFEKATESYTKAKDLFSTIFTISHPDYVKVVSKLGKVYFLTGNYDAATASLNESTKNYLLFIKKHFPSLSDREKAKFWTLIKPDFEFYNTLALKQLKSHPELIQNIYNFTLYTKALLLSSTIKIKNRILNSDDELLKQQYTQWIDKKEYLTSVLSMSTEQLAENNIVPAEIEKEVEQLEKVLSEKSTLFAQQFEIQNYTWQEVKKTLKKDEAAIEIVRFRYFEDTFTDSIQYMAMIITPQYKVPKVVLLSNGRALENELLNYYKNAIRFNISDESSYQNYWQPIAKELGKAKTVYFSADGAYNQINLESLFIQDSTFVFDKHDILLVSNTKDLIPQEIKVKKGENVLDNSATLFGNPNFYALPQKNTNNNITQLPGAAIEIKEVNSILTGQGWQTHMYTENAATEDSVKKTFNPKVFHIATHGFFAANLKEDKETSENNDYQASQSSLLRSGLLLKGAGDILKNTQYNYNTQDGILTAYEAMNLNLDNTELVVLSACETGLGQVQVGEGVFGLQRSFLVAGADAVIMSLFKVSDEITQKLMTKFYEKWLKLGNKRKAFKEAQAEIKAEYPSPNHWGAFVMIGIN